ncbi:hypothetical protein Tco_0359580 [Tanacetum coccineum]
MVDDLTPQSYQSHSSIIYWKRIFKKRSKKKAKNKQIQAREGKDQVKSKSKSHPLEEITTSGAKTAKLKVGTKLHTSPKKVFFPTLKPLTTGVRPNTFITAKPLLSLAKIISSTLLPPPPSCIKAMLAIPHLSQVSSMAKIDSKEAQMKSKLDFALITSHNKAHFDFALQKKPSWQAKLRQ